jgi:hypothetical protein
MKSLFLMICLIIISSLPYVAASQLDIELAKVKVKMDKRQKKIELIQKTIKENAARKNMPFSSKESSPSHKVIALTCKKGWFGWGSEKSGIEYKDCSYKYSPTTTGDINRLAQSIKEHMAKGWEIDRTELFKQDVSSPKNIINVDRYRYIRKIEE